MNTQTKLDSFTTAYIEPLFAVAMSEEEASAFVRAHSDDDQLDEQQLAAAFRAIFDRDATDEDREEGLWSHLCAAVVWPILIPVDGGSNAGAEIATINHDPDCDPEGERQAKGDA